MALWKHKTKKRFNCFRRSLRNFNEVLCFDCLYDCDTTLENVIFVLLLEIRFQYYILVYAQSASPIRRNGVKLSSNILRYVRTRCAQISWRHRLILTVKHICLEIRIICIINDEG